MTNKQSDQPIRRAGAGGELPLGGVWRRGPIEVSRQAQGCRAYHVSLAGRVAPVEFATMPSRAQLLQVLRDRWKLVAPDLYYHARRRVWLAADDGQAPPFSRGPLLEGLATAQTALREAQLRRKRAARASRLSQRRNRAGELLAWRTWRLAECVQIAERIWIGPVLTSPYRDTIWHGPVLRADNWTDGDVVRGMAGLHACFRHSRECQEREAEAEYAPAHLIMGRIRVPVGSPVAVATRDVQGLRSEVQVVDLLVLPATTPPVTIRALRARYLCHIVVRTPAGGYLRIRY